MINVEMNGNISIMTVDENIVSENISDFEKCIEKMTEGDYTSYAFNFSGVEYLCSSALGILAHVLRKSFESSSTVYFCALSEPLRKLFDMTKFLPMVKEFNSIDDVLVQVK